MEDNTPQEVEVVHHHIPTVAELRLRMVRCEWCGKHYKNLRSLRQHQARNSKCQQARHRKEQRRKGFIRVELSASLATLGAEAGLLESLDTLDSKHVWIPIWFVHLVRTLGIERYNTTTPVTARVGGRWAGTPKLFAETARAACSPVRQQALMFMYELELKWRQYEARCIRERITLSTSTAEDTRAELCRLPEPAHTS